MAILNKIRLVCFILGFAGFVVSERYLQFEAYHLYALILSVLLAGAATLLPIIDAVKSKKAGRAGESLSWALVATWQLAVLGGMACFLVYAKVMGTATAPESFLTKLLLALWLLFFILGGFAGIGIEIAHANAGTGNLAEPRRVRRSGLSWLMVGMVLAILVCFNYAGVKRDKVSDWSYLKTTTPSSATIAMLKATVEPLEVHVFFPNDNDVRPFVAEYFDYLSANGSANLKVTYHDKDIEPMLAEEMKVSRNGQVIFKSGEKRERIDVGLDVSAARQMLRKFDSEVQKQILRLTAEKKKLYFTRGHGELGWASTSKDPMRSLDLVETLLRGQNYTVTTFSLAEGAGSDVPADAAAVVVVGHDQPFLQQEADALWRYVEGGGHLAVFLDPIGGSRETPAILQNQTDPLIEMLKKAGLNYQKNLLANETNHMQATRTPADNWFLFTNSFSSHDSVSNLSRNDERAAVLIFQAGYFDTQPQSGEWRATTTVRSVAETFVDENRNSKFDGGKEKRQTYTIGAVSTRPVKITDKDGKPLESEGKIVAFGDATAFSDLLLRNRANALLLVDSLKWLTGQADLMGELSSEEDVKIQHTSKEDAIWFNATVVVVPALILIAGFIATRKRRNKGAAR